MPDDKRKKAFLGIEVANMIQQIAHYIDSGEYNQSPMEFCEARRLLNNQLPQLIDQWVADERQQAFLLGIRTAMDPTRRKEWEIPDPASKG
jgi:hypothetical protein